MKSRLSIISVVLLGLCSSYVFAADDAKSPLRRVTSLPGSPESFGSSESSFGRADGSSSPALKISSEDAKKALKDYTAKWLAGMEARVADRKETAQKLKIEVSAFNEAYALVENTYLDFIYSNEESSSFWDAVGNVPDFNSLNDLIERMKLFKQNQYGYYESPCIEIHSPSISLVYMLSQLRRMCSDIAHMIFVVTLADSWPQGSENVKDWRQVLPLTTGMDQVDVRDCKSPRNFFSGMALRDELKYPFITEEAVMHFCKDHTAEFYRDGASPDGFADVEGLIIEARAAAANYRSLQLKVTSDYC